MTHRIELLNFKLASGLFSAGGMGLWHGVEFYENEKLVGEREFLRPKVIIISLVMTLEIRVTTVGRFSNRMSTLGSKITQETHHSLLSVFLTGLEGRFADRLRLVFIIQFENGMKDFD